MWQIWQRWWRRERPADPELIERLVEVASPRIRLARGYQETLAPVVARAAQALQALEQKMPRPVALTTENWRANPLLGLAFASPARMAEVVNASVPIRRWFEANPLAERAFAVLSMTREIESRYGMEERDGFVRQDVLQQILVLRDHRFGVPVDSEALLAPQACRRGLEELALHAARRIEGLEAERALIESEINTLRVALRLGGSTDPLSASSMQRQRQKRLTALTDDLVTTRAALEADHQLTILCSSLRDPARQLRFCETALEVDALGVLRPGAPEAHRLQQVEIEMIDEEPVQRVLLPVEIPRALWRREDPAVGVDIFSVTAF